MHSKSSANRQRRRALLPIVCVALLGVVAWIGSPSTSTGNYVAGNAWQSAVPIPQSITLLEDSVVGGNKIHGVVRIFSRVSGENTVKLQTDKPDVLRAPGGSVWPAVISIPSGTETSFEFDTNAVTEATQVRLFACKSSLANADCTDENSNALVTFTVMPPDAQPDRSDVTPHNVEPIPVGLSPSLRAVLGGVVDFDLTAHTILRTMGSGTSDSGTFLTSATPLPESMSGSTTTTSTSTSSGEPATGTTTGGTYEVDTDHRSLLVAPNVSRVWPVTQTFNGGFNALLRIKTRSPQKVGAASPVYVKIFARQPGAVKTAITTIQVQ